MTCPQCGGSNFAWAKRCDHCGAALSTPDPASPSATTAQPAPEHPVAVDPDALRRHLVLQRLFIATPYAIVTPILIALNVAVFVVMVARGVDPLSPGGSELLPWGANYGPLTTHGQSWRLLTAMFLHFGIVHLATNMLVLWNVGALTERLFGRAAFTALYFLSGIAGSLASVLWHPSGISAGASGAIFGVCGGLLAMLLVGRGAMPSDFVVNLMTRGGSLVLINLLYGFVDTHIDMTAHLGGLVGGLAIGSGLAVAEATDLAAARRTRTAAVTAVATLLLGVATARLPAVDDLNTQVRRAEAVGAIVTARYAEALAQLEASKISRDDFARVVDRDVLQPWNDARAKVESLKLPADQRATSRQFTNYMALRADAWRLAAQGIREKNDALVAESALKEDQALTALYDITKDKKVADELAARRARRAEFTAQRQVADRFVAELRRVSRVERDSVAAIADTVKKLRSGQMTREQASAAIDKRVLAPWNDERAALAQTKPTPNQKTFAADVDRYMGLRAQAWQLMSRALRDDDNELMKSAAAKQAEAMELSRAIQELMNVPPAEQK